jgi:hypothetical protein
MRAAVTLVVCLISLLATRAWARPVRRLFEPTDLELEDPGVAEVDLQMGLIRGRHRYRLVIPDFEIDLGLTRQVELDVDGAVAVEDRAGQTFEFDHVTPDDLWLSAKLGLLAAQLTQGHGAGDVVVGFGLQLGPKLPTAREAEGVGVEGLGLVGLRWRQTQAILNLGGLLDPGVGRAGRPAGLEGGIDLDQGLDAAGVWSFKGELGGVRFLSADADQLTGTAGFAFHPTDRLEISLIGLAGLTAGSDRYGVLLGISQKLRLWH